MGRYSDHTYRKRQEALRRLTRANGTPCAACGAPFDWDAPYTHPLSFTADHVRSIKSGGSLYGVLQPMHRACNSRKGGDGRRVRVSRPEGVGFW